MPETLIVIPCLNEEDHLEKLVRNLVATSSPQDTCIIIADGASTDRTPLIAQKLAAEFPHVHYLLNPKRLQSAAINLAVSTFGNGATYLIRIDAHADYPSNFCATLLEEAKHTTAQSVVVSMDTVGTSGFQKAVAAAQNSKLGNGGSAHRVPKKTSQEQDNSDGEWVDHGHHALMRIDAFQTVGGYDETFSHNEDAELDIRLRHAGYKIWLTRKTSLIYYPRSSAKSLFRQYFKFGEGRAKTLLKHKVKPRIRQMAPLVVVPAVILFPLGGIFILPLSAWMVLCITYGLFLGKRAKDPDIFLSGYAIMIMHVAWSAGFWQHAILSVFRKKTGG